MRLTPRGWVCLWLVAIGLSAAVNIALANKQVECRVENLSTCQITTTTNNNGDN